MVNVEKSSVHFNKNSSDNLTKSICNVLFMKECDHVSNYLGLLFVKQDKKKKSYFFGSGGESKKSDKRLEDEYNNPSWKN